MMKHISINYITGPTAAMADRLFGTTGYPLLSIYMPTFEAGADVWQNPIRFKNLLREAETNLEKGGIDSDKIRLFMRPLNELQENREFWQNQTAGLALFRSTNGLEQFHLPTPVPELSLVSDRYHLKPLLMTATDESAFFVLALSQHKSRLFHGSAWGLHEVEGLEMPEGLDARDETGNPGLQSHPIGAGERIQHGREDDRKKRMADYFRKVDQAIGATIGEKDLLILAAVDYVAGTYREISSLKGISETTLAGNFDEATARELYEKAKPIAEKRFDERIVEAGERFLQTLRMGNGKALDDPRKAIEAARAGRVETLFVPVGVQIWGEFAEGGELTFDKTRGGRSHDLLNDAALDTWKSGGRVLAIAPEKMPGGCEVAAITRF